MEREPTPGMSYELPPPPPPPREDRPWAGAGGAQGSRRRGLIAGGLAAFLLVAAAVGLMFVAGPSTTLPPSGSTSVRTVPQSSSAVDRTEKGLDVQAVANKVSPGVVDINTVLGPLNGSGVAGRAAGTGMILTSSGELLTNNHVIQNATAIRVTIDGRGTYAAKVLGADPTGDVALLQIQGASRLPTVTLADSSSLRLGQDVVAIGNALGQGGSPTVTAGTVTALDRSITASNEGGLGEHLKGLIQTDATISPGDSGGALANAAGQVVGMITAGASGNNTTSASTSTNVGFAIPTNAAVAVVQQIRSGHAGPSVIIGQPGYLGVEVSPFDRAAAARLGLNVSSGVVVAGVVPGTPAAQIGMRPGSVITAVDGRSITSIQQVGTALHSHKPGEQVRVTWVDQTGTHSATARLISGPAV